MKPLLECIKDYMTYELTQQEAVKCTYIEQTIAAEVARTYHLYKPAARKCKTSNDKTKRRKWTRYGIC